MRILWIHQNYVSSSDGGNSRAETVINAFLSAGWSVDIICSNETYFGKKRSTHHTNRDGVTIHCLDLQTKKSVKRRNKRSSYFEFCYKSILYLRKLSKPDLIFSSSPPLPQSLAGIVATHYFKVPLVIEVRDLWPAFLTDGKLIHSTFLTYSLHWVEMLFYKQADHCVSVSPGFSPYLRKVIPAETPFTVLPTAQNTSLKTSSQLFAEKRRFENAFVIIYAGSMNESYGIDYLLNTAIYTTHMAKDIQWLFAGEGRESYKIKTAAASNSQIHYLGNLPKAEIIPIMKSCDLAINSHAKWALLDTVITGKLIDYMSCSLPIVSSSPGIIKNILEDSGSGITCHHNDMGTAIFQIKNLDSAKRKEMGKRGRQWLNYHIDSQHFEKSMQQIALDTSQKRSASKLKLIADILRSFNDIILNVPQKAIKQFYCDEVRQEVLNQAFSDWVSSIKSKKSEKSSR